MVKQLLALALLCTSCQLYAQKALTTDPNLKTGKLANGLTYYIRKNQEPKNRAELRLVVKAGSVLETDNQQGLAHFVEHMSFNGTKNFKKQELVSFLEKSGVSFGADLNAYTSFDETVYELPLPTDSPTLFKKGFQILADWAHAVTFDGTEIDKERGVILEERRVRRNAGQRMLYQWMPVVLNGSQYAKRIPIGDSLILTNFKHATLKQFYSDWYRPDLQAIVAVGDFDVAAVEKTIKELFSKIPVKAKKVKPSFSIPTHTDVKHIIATDPEQQYNIVQVMYKQGKEKPVLTDIDYRQILCNSLYSEMANMRLQELTQKADAPFLYGNSSYGELLGGLSSFTLLAVAKDGASLQKSLDALLAESERIKRFGFNQSELERAKKSILSSIENRYNERNKTNSKAYTNEYVSLFLKGGVSTSIETDFELYKSLLPQIKLDEVNTLIKKWIKETDRAVVVMAPEKEKANLPSSAVFAASLNKPIGDLKPYEDKVAKGGLMPVAPTAGKVVKETTIAELSVTEWTLSNGAKVIVKPTDFKNDEIQISAISPGGKSLITDADYITGDNADQIIQLGGIGNLGIMELQKEMTGKQASVSPSIRNYSEGFGGSSTPKDLETAMQLLHLYFTQPRKDETMFNVLKNQANTILANKNTNPQAVFADTMQYLMGNYHPRSKPFEISMIQQLNLDKAIAIYKERFAGADDFIFTFVGNIKLDVLKALVEKYIASLPATGKKETWKDVGLRYPTGIIEKKVYKGKEAKATVRLVYTGEATYSEEEATQLSQLGKALNIKLRENLREEKGGTYGTGVSTELSRIPYQSYSIDISWTCDPSKVNELIEAAVSEIKKIKENGSTQEDIQKVIAEDTRAMEVQLRENGYWIYNLEDRYRNNEDPRLILKDMETIKKINVAKTKEMANKYFNEKNMIKAILLPEQKN